MKAVRRTLEPGEEDGIRQDIQAGMRGKDLERKWNRSPATFSRIRNNDPPALIAKPVKRRRPAAKPSTGSLALVQQAIDQVNSAVMPSPQDIVRQAVATLVSTLQGLPIRLMGINFREGEATVEYALVETFKIG